MLLILFETKNTTNKKQVWSSTSGRERPLHATVYIVQEYIPIYNMYLIYRYCLNISLFTCRKTSVLLSYSPSVNGEHRIKHKASALIAAD